MCVHVVGAGIIPFLYLTLPFFTFYRSSLFFFFSVRVPFLLPFSHKPFPYCFNKHLKCLALATYARCTHKMSATTSSSPPICGISVEEWGRGACQDTDEKYDKTLLNHLKILQLTLLFFIRLMKVFRLFGFVSRAAAVAVAARQQTFS